MVSIEKLIRRYIASGQLGATKIGSTYRIPKDALEYFINNYSNIAGREDDYKIKNSPRIDSVNWFNLEKNWEHPTKSQMTFVDCFCGAGGLSGYIGHDDGGI